MLVEIAARLDVEILSRALTESWCMAEFPERYVSRETWLEMFDLVGYIVNGEPAKPPAEMVLYRGGGPEPDRMAWTSDRVTAEWFRDRFNGQLWTTTAPSTHLLAHVNNVICRRISPFPAVTHDGHTGQKPSWVTHYL